MLDIPVFVKDKEYRVRADDRQYMLCSKSVHKETGEVKWAGYKFFISLSSLFEVLTHMKIRNSDARTLEELEYEIKKASKEVREYWDTTK